MDREQREAIEDKFYEDEYLSLIKDLSTSSDTYSCFCEHISTRNIDKLVSSAAIHKLSAFMIDNGCLETTGIHRWADQAMRDTRVFDIQDSIVNVYSNARYQFDFQIKRLENKYIIFPGSDTTDAFNAFFALATIFHGDKIYEEYVRLSKQDDSYFLSSKGFFKKSYNLCYHSEYDKYTANQLKDNVEINVYELVALGQLAYEKIGLDISRKSKLVREFIDSNCNLPIGMLKDTMLKVSSKENIRHLAYLLPLELMCYATR